MTPDRFFAPCRHWKGMVFARRMLQSPRVPAPYIEAFFPGSLIDICYRVGSKIALLRPMLATDRCWNEQDHLRTPDPSLYRVDDGVDQPRPA